MQNIRRDNYHIPCPVCPSSDGFCIYTDGHGYCYSCKIFIHPDDERIDELFTFEYLPLRGINQPTLEFYDVKTKIDPEGLPLSVGFRYPNGSFKHRLLSKKDFFSEGDISHAGLFGRDKFEGGTAKAVTITEGELDALSYYQVLHSPVVSVQSSSSALRDCTVDRDFLQSFDRIYLAFDNDTAGREATKAVARLFDYNKVFIVKFTKRKDANAYLEAGEDTDLRLVWNNAKKYMPETIKSTFSEFKEILQDRPRWGIPYPFKTLTDMTYGIRTSETVLFRALEGVGKTELMHAIEHKILKETDYAVGAIFLEEPKARHLQALAGIELHEPVHLPSSLRTTDQIFAALEEVVQKDERLHVYSHYGSDDPEVLLDIIRFLVSARGCRVILFDHLSIAVSGLPGEKDERRALDYLTTRLEMMVMELDFALIMVTHVNDDGLTRGSRNASKVTHIQVDLSRNLLHPDPVERNTTHLLVSKNRFGMKTGPAGKLLFNPETYSYEEIT